MPFITVIINNHKHDQGALLGLAVLIFNINKKTCIRKTFSVREGKLGEDPLILKETSRKFLLYHKLTRRRSEAEVAAQQPDNKNNNKNKQQQQQQQRRSSLFG